MRNNPHTFGEPGRPCSETLWWIKRKRNSHLGIAIALFPHDALNHKSDYEEENMKTARLIKRNQLCKSFDMEEQRQPGSQIASTGARKSAVKWVQERQELRQVNPRAQFAALFRMG